MGVDFAPSKGVFTPMSREKPIQLVKTYGERLPLAKIRQLPSKDCRIDTLRAEYAQLDRDYNALLSRYQKMCEVVKWEVAFWEQVLLEGKSEEGPTALRRRLSMLRGALAFRGVAEWAQKKQEK
jgi:hypothetical protein